MKRPSGRHPHRLTLAFLATITILLGGGQGSAANSYAAAIANPVMERLFQPTMLAQNRARRTRGYQPPRRTRQPRRTVAGGTRGFGGCDGTAAISPVILVPQAHVGQTSNPHPTLVWYVADEASYPVTVQLYRYRSENPEDDRLELITAVEVGPSHPGFMSFTLGPDLLPPDQAALRVGDIYRWKVILDCFPGLPSRSVVEEADMEIVAHPGDLPSLASDPVERALQLEAAGLWYDTIAALSEEPVSPDAAAYRLELLEDLAAFEAENPNDAESRFSQRLRYVVDPTGFDPNVVDPSVVDPAGVDPTVEPGPD